MWREIKFLYNWAYVQHMQQAHSDCFSILSWSKRKKEKKKYLLCSCFPGSLGETQGFLPEEMSRPWAGFTRYEIYFTSQSMAYNPSGETGGGGGEACLLSACLQRPPPPPPPLSCTFLGNSHDENTESGNLSMDQICWEASESEVQLHRLGEKEKHVWRAAARGREREENKKLSTVAQVFILSDSAEGELHHYFVSYEFLMLCLWTEIAFLMLFIKFLTLLYPLTQRVNITKLKFWFGKDFLPSKNQTLSSH